MKSNTEKKESKKIEINADDLYKLCISFIALAISYDLLQKKVRDLQK